MRRLSDSDIVSLLNSYSRIGAAQTARDFKIEYSRCKKIIVDSGKWKPPFNASKHHEFHRELPKGRKFIRMYMESYGDGTILKLSKEFGISPALVQRIRKKLNLPHLHSKEHPGKRKFYKRIRKLYCAKNRSTIQIAKILRISSQRVNQILREQNIALRPQYCVNPLYYKTRSPIGHSRLLELIRKHYLDDKWNIRKVAQELHIDQCAVSTKLKAMGIPIRKNRMLMQMKGICIWCNETISNLYISVGEKRQKFCNSKCKNKCKDLRRGPERSPDRFRSLALEFRGSISNLGLKPTVYRLVQSIRKDSCIEKGIYEHQNLQTIPT